MMLKPKTKTACLVAGAALVSVWSPAIVRAGLPTETMSSTSWYDISFPGANKSAVIPKGEIVPRPLVPGAPEPAEVGPPPPFYGHDVALRGCVVTGAHLTYNAAADAPLISPPAYSAPAPGRPNSNAQGPVNGPQPGTNPVTIFTGNAFEYHSDLNGKHGCSSEQYKRAILMEVTVATGRIVQAQGNGFGPRAGWLVDAVRPGAGPAPFARGLSTGAPTPASSDLPVGSSTREPRSAFTGSMRRVGRSRQAGHRVLWRYSSHS